MSNALNGSEQDDEDSNPSDDPAANRDATPRQNGTFHALQQPQDQQRPDREDLMNGQQEDEDQEDEGEEDEGEEGVEEREDEGEQEQEQEETPPATPISTRNSLGLIGVGEWRSQGYGDISVWTPSGTPPPTNEYFLAPDPLEETSDDDPPAARPEEP